VVLSLFCRNAPVARRPWPARSRPRRFNSSPWISTRTGDFDVRGKLTNADGATRRSIAATTVDNRPVFADPHHGRQSRPRRAPGSRRACWRTTVRATVVAGNGRDY
jgi:hypothetical protein